MTPRLEIVHPGGTSLNDLQFLEPFVPVTVSPSDHVFGLLVGGLNVPQRHLFLAVREDPVKMFLHHDRKALQGLHPAPLEGVDPFPEELHGPCSGLVLPEMAEGLLEKVGLHEPGAYEEEGLQSFSGLLPKMGLSGQENKLLSGQQSLHRLSQPLELLLSHLVDGIEEVTDHVEFVVDHLGLGTMGQKALPKGLPHVHDAMRDPTGPILSEPLPKGLQVLLLAPLHDVQEFRSPGAFQGADHGPVGLAPFPTPISSNPRTVIPSSDRSDWIFSSQALSISLTVPRCSP